MEYTIGDVVPPIAKKRMNYSIAMREGRYVNITDDKVESWTDEAKYDLVLDKWGKVFSNEGSRGLIDLYIDEDYFY